MKCRECAYYKAIDEECGSCYGVRIRGERDPRTESDKCQGKFFKPRESSREKQCFASRVKGKHEG